MTEITLPSDAKPSRLGARRTVAPRESDDVLETLREYERLARVASPAYTIASRFTADGDKWVPLWLSEDIPGGVKTAIVRDGVITEEARSWAESIPADEEGRARWLGNPATLLRAFVERATYRRAFADVIVGREVPARAVDIRPSAPDLAPVRGRSEVPEPAAPSVTTPPAPITPRPPSPSVPRLGDPVKRPRGAAS